MRTQISLTRTTLYVVMLLGIFLSALGGENLSAVYAQQAGTETPIAESRPKGSLKVTSTIPIPNELLASVVGTLQSRSVDILPGDSLIITSLDQIPGWAIMTVAVLPEDPNQDILLNSTLVIAKIDSGDWNSAILGTDAYEILLAEVPTSLVSAESKSLLSTLATDSPSSPEPLAISTPLRWPWASNSRWTMTQGPHSWYGNDGIHTDKSAIDFASLDGNRDVHAAFQGTIIRRCEDSIQHEVIIRHPTGTGTDDVTGYLHLDKNGPYAPIVGALINQGDTIGSYYNGAIPKGTTCGWGTGGHLHFWIATIPTNVSSTSISSFSLGNMYGQTISDWQMQQSDNCFHQGSDKICPGVPIPGDGSTPGPRPPSNLSASAVSSSQINLSWSGSPDSVDGYRVWSGGAIVANNVTSTSYSFSGLSSCSTYSFYVTAYKGDLSSSASNTTSAKTSGCLSGAPSAPSLNSPGNGQVFPRFGDIYLTWNSNGSYQYLIEFWGGPDGGKSNLGWQSGTSLFFGNGNWGGNYSWHVKARNSSGQVSDWSETRSFFKKYGTPGNVGVSALSDSQTRLTWSASADAPGNIEGYMIYRDGQLRSITGSGSTSFDDYGLNCNSSYSYYLKAYKGNGESDQSSTVSVTTNSCPPAATPDLVVQSITASPSNPFINQPVTFTVRIANQGSGDATSSFYVDFFVDNQPGSCPAEGIVYWPIDSLAAGATLDLSYTYPGFSTSGAHSLYAFTDSFCQIPESNDGNNILGPVTITVQQVQPPLSYTDIILYRGGAWLPFDFVTGNMVGGVWTGQPSSSCIPAPIDYDGDGIKEYSQLCGGAWYFYNDNGSLNKGIWVGSIAGDVPVPGDYNGDGTDEVVLWRNGAWLFYNFVSGTMTGGVWTGAPVFGGVPARPVPMDYDGDGALDFTTFSGGPWHFYNDNGSLNKGIWTGGVSGDLPVPGDYNGDGTEEVALWRNGAWLFFNFVSGTMTGGVWTGAPVFGGIVAKPAPLDYDRDGALDFTTFSGGPWHFYNDNGSLNKGIWTGGVTGDIPISRRYLP